MAYELLKEVVANANRYSGGNYDFNIHIEVLEDDLSVTVIGSHVDSDNGTDIKARVWETDQKIDEISILKVVIEGESEETTYISASGANLCRVLYA